VCGLCLPPQEDTVVLLVDEKTGSQAKSSERPTRPLRPGRRARREFEHFRHGTASLMAAMDVATGKVLATDILRNDSIILLSLREEIDERIGDD
jgi:hypothetical protein